MPNCPACRNPLNPPEWLQTLSGVAFPGFDRLNLWSEIGPDALVAVRALAALRLH